ncbi:hypothetical protein SAMN04488024_101518 [Pedobacter soli]|uniref:Uncharacterized protein n=1 Tax=Pedobacter soli TaxID=390242 RepID=A0A1G6JPS6_9SPHI|nr:hypothetical protein SAMN04488024_101518 [Pedobacter soli]
MGVEFKLPNFSEYFNELLLRDFKKERRHCEARSSLKAYAISSNRCKIASAAEKAFSQ